LLALRTRDEHQSGRVPARLATLHVHVPCSSATHATDQGDGASAVCSPLARSVVTVVVTVPPVTTRGEPASTGANGPGEMQSLLVKSRPPGTVLARFQPARPYPNHSGALPSRHLMLQSRRRTAAPSGTPALRGGRGNLTRTAGHEASSSSSERAVAARRNH
jgi:hypothetical protein